MGEDQQSGFANIDDLHVEIELWPLEDLPRDLSAALEYWRSMTPAGRVGPRWMEFDLMRLPLAYLPTAVVVDHDATSGVFRYRYWGSHLTPVFGTDLTGKTFDDAPGSFTEVSYRSYGVVVEQKQPCLVEFRVKVPGEEATFQTALRLPLSEDGEYVSGIVSLLLIEYKKHEWEALWR